MDEGKQRENLNEEAASREEIMLAMPDGVRLRTVILRPKQEGARPTIVMRSCYPGNEEYYRKLAARHLRHGYAFIYQFCRGTGGSEGVWEPNVNERADGSAALSWICAQDWVGSVGYLGCSYLALTGWAIADIVPDKVKTMYLTHYGTNRFVSAYMDGLFRHDVLTAWAMGNAGFEVKADYLDSCRHLPHLMVDEDLWGKKIPWYRDWITNTDRTAEYWREGFWGELKEIPSRVRIPICIVEGWFDHHLGSAIETWKALPAEVRAKSQFVIGAWNHGFGPCCEGKTEEHLENDDEQRAFEWMEKILVRGETPEGKIRTYIPGADSWTERKSYEIPEQREVRFSLRDFHEEGKTSHAVDPDGTIYSYTYDPADPTPTWGAESVLCTPGIQGSRLQPEPGYREDVISLVSAPLEEEMTVMGGVRICLRVASDAEDTAFAVRIMEVEADGRAYNMRTGITTTGYRGHSDRRQTYTPGDPAMIEIAPWDLAWRLKKGSRLRIDIASADFPQYAVHTNYPGCWALQEKRKKARQTVFSADSYLTIPVI